MNSDSNKVYTYDGLNQVASFNRGVGARTQSFDYDALGSRDGVTTNGTTQTYTANKQNEITGISGATTPTYDANGNMTGDETGKLFVYDAWNRMVAVKSGATVLKSYSYDGLNRRVTETASGVTTDLYYSAGWQVLEEKIGSVIKARYVWSPVYVDALILRDRPDVGDRQYVQQDANWNVTALVSTGGAIVERYAYDPYGKATVYSASWTVLGGSAYGWVYLHQGGRADGVSGLVHFRNRDYSVTLGRWVTMDPMGYGAGDTNLFRAESNGTPNGLDPSGLEERDRWQMPTRTGIVSAWHHIVDHELKPLTTLVPALGTGLSRASHNYIDQNADGFVIGTSIVAAGGLFVHNMFLSDDINPTAVGAPGFWEGLIPVWGSGRSMVNSFENGRYGSGVFWGAMVVADFFLVGRVIYLGRAGLRGLAASTGRESATTTIPWKYGATGDALGQCDKYGNITIRSGLTGEALEQVVAHEGVHHFASPVRGPFYELRAALGMGSYQRSHFYRFLEEALAESVGSRSILQGLRFPIELGYVSEIRVIAEPSGYLTTLIARALFPTTSNTVK